MTGRLALVLALLLQGGPSSPAPAPAPARPRGFTVGDTIWVTRAVAVPRGRTVRAAEWELPAGEDVELLGRGRVVARGDSAFVRYPAVVWRPGPHTLTVPGPLLLASDGRLDSLPPLSLTFTVASVLPAGVPESTLPAQPPTGVVLQLERSPVPLLLLLLLAAAVLAPLWWWWRRRGRAATPDVAAAPGVPVPYERWAEAGEYHAVAAAAALRLRRWIARRVPGAHEGLDTRELLLHLGEVRSNWPQAAVARLLRALDEARFAPAPSPEAPRLAAEAERLEQRLAELEAGRGTVPLVQASTGETAAAGGAA